MSFNKPPMGGLFLRNLSGNPEILAQKHALFFCNQVTTLSANARCTAGRAVKRSIYSFDIGIIV